jgi:predicted MFS family arabinose efflux permease
MIAGTVAFMVFNPTVFLFAVNTVILFIGVGFEFIALITYILAAVPQTATGTQTGLNSIFRFIGQSAGAVMAGVVMAAFSVDNVPRLIAYQYIGVIALVLACISLLMTFAIPDLRMPERQGAVAAAT